MESIGNSPESVAHAFLRFINRHDVDALAALMSPGHRLVDALGNVVVGAENLRAGWEAYFRMVPDYAVAIEETYPSGPVVMMLGVAQGTFTRNGKLHPENRWQTPIALRAQIDNLQVYEWRIYADNEPLRKVISTGK